MEKLPFRDFHLINLLENYSSSNCPIDIAICEYFRAHKALGSKDRYEISETVYALVRWQILLDALSQEISWQERLKTFRSDIWKSPPSSLPPHIKVSFPEVLYQKLTNTFYNETDSICLTCNKPAPICVRVNTLKISRDELLARWKDLHRVSPTLHSPHGIIFHKKIHFFSLPEFKEGLFEIQDEASQLVAELVQAHPGDLVMDYCAGAGGKALAIAPRMQNRGQLYLHDVRKHSLIEAKRRLKRAGIQNAQQLPEGHPALSSLKKKMDWILVDAPCTGTGTLRRNPDMKWKFNEQLLERLIGQQRTIFEKALSYLKPHGKIVYATCSLLKEENEQQVEHFIKTYDLNIVGAPLRTVPKEKEMDGFFAISLKKIN